MNNQDQTPAPSLTSRSRMRALKPLTSLAAVCLLLGGFQSARATSDAWDGSTDGVWATSANWLTDPAAVPGTGDIATFNGAGNDNTLIDLGGGVTISNVTFDPGAAAYTLGAGAVGSQILSLDNAGAIALNSGLANNQLLNAVLSLSSVSNASASILNNSSALLTLAGGVVANGAGSAGVLTVSGSGNTLFLRPVTRGSASTGTNALLKTGSGMLTLSSNSVWIGSGAIGRVPATSAGFPLVAREGVLKLNGGTHTVTGELVIGGVVADGGAGQNAMLLVDGCTLNVSSWFSVGRGNGVGGVSSDLVLTNGATVTAANFSAGYDGGSSTNKPKGAITLNGSSTITIGGNGEFKIGESAGSDTTLTVNDTAQVIAAGTGFKALGQGGKGTVNLSGSGLINFGNATTYIGWRTGTGVVNIASGTFRNSGEVRVGGSDQNGTANKANGTINMTGGAAYLGALTLGRGNNNQNECSGLVVLSNAAMTVTNDVVLGYAGTNNSGVLTINSGGVFNIGPTATKWLMVGYYDYTHGEININAGGTLNLLNNTAIKFTRGNSALVNTNTVNQNGGAVTCYADGGTTIDGTGGNIDLQQTGAAQSVGIYNLNGGILTAADVRSSGTTGTRIFNFNGGTLRAAATDGRALLNLGSGTGIARVNVRNGGAIIDTAGKNTSIQTVLDHSDIVGDNAVDGGLTKIGNGTLALSAATYYTGPTTLRGGTLSLSPSSVSYGATSGLSVSNATLALDVSGGGYSLTTGNVDLQNNATLTLNFGTLFGNPFVASVNASGSLTAPGTNIVINFSGTGFTTGAFPLIDYSGTPLANVANFKLGTLPPGVVAVITNNTANTSVDILVTSVGQLLTWYGADSVGNVLPNWDINNSLNWNFGSAKYLEYGAYGDLVTFNDNVYNLQVTNVTLNTTVVPAQVVVDSSMAYSISGTGGISGSAAITKNNIGSLALNTANTHTGGTLVNAGSLVFTNDNALGVAGGLVTLGGGTLQAGGNLTSSRPVTLTNNSAIGVVAGATAQFSGQFAGAGTLTKTDTGTLNLAGANTNTLGYTVKAGTLGLAGTLDTTGLISVADTLGYNAVMNITGTVRANNDPGQFGGSLRVGSVGSDAAAVRMTAGSLFTKQQLSIGGAAGAYGAFTLGGGSATLGSFIVVGFNSDYGVFNQTGGSVTLSNNLITVAAGNDGANGLVNLSGGTFDSLATTGNGSTIGGAFIGEFGTGTLNVSGSAQVNLSGWGLRLGHTATGDGVANLLGGTVSTVSASGGPGTSYLNFNGGTLKARTNTTAFIANLTAATVYSGGAIVDDGGFNVGFGQPLLAPTGAGVSSIPVSTGGANYIGTPLVVISGDGTNATAVANVSGGVVTGITITSPGFGYTYAFASLLGGVGFDGTAATLGTPVLTANTSGGLTKTGNGTLTLTGTNTYTGPTTIAQGTLILTPAQQVTNSAVVLSNAAKLTISANGNAATRVGDLVVGSVSTDLSTIQILLPTGTNPVSAVLECGNLTLNGTNAIQVTGLLTAGTFPVLKYRGTFTGASRLSPVAITPHGYSGLVSNDVATSTIYVTLSGAGSIVWQGYNTDPARTNLWDIDQSTNWLSGLSPSTYAEGDKVVFNDTGSGLVLVSNSVSPGGIVFTNNTVNYTVQGPGQIAGVGGVTKLGPGNATLNLTANNFTGPTVVSNGTLTLVGGGAIGDLSAVTLANTTGAGLVVSNTETVGSLAGGGANGGNVTIAGQLTVGANNSSTTYGGAITGPGRLVVNGTGSLTVTGSVTTGNELWVGGVNAANTPTLNIPAGAAVDVSGWLVLGRDGSTGTLNINGGSLIHNGDGNLTLGTLGTNPKGILNLTSGTISNLTGETFLGEGSSAVNYGVYNQSGGTAYLGTLRVGRGSSGGSGIGTATITGGSLTTADLDIGYGNNNTRFGTNVVTISGGATVTATGEVRLGFAGSTTMWGILTNNGGTLNVGTFLTLCQWDSTHSEVTLDAGAINLLNNSSIRFASEGNAGSGTFNHNGGTVTFYSDGGTNVGGTGYLDMDFESGNNSWNQSSGTYTYNLNGGTLTVPRIQKTEDSPSTTTFNFNGGRLRAAASSATFMQGIASAYVLAGANIDTMANDITIGQALLDGGLGGGLNKSGTGTLTLSGVNTYTGTTTVSNGTLLVNGSIPGVVTVKSGAKVGGTGTIGGVVTVEPGASLGAGASIGTLTLGATPVLNGAVVAEIDRNGGSPLADLIDLAGNPVNYGGTLVVSNVGLALQAGDTFTLFSAAAHNGNFTSIVGQAGVTYAFTNGVLTVVSAMASNPTNITWSVGGGSLNLSWPADHLGWILQAQTNTLGIGLTTSWVDVPGSAAVTATNFPVNPANPTVFYRLRQP